MRIRIQWRGKGHLARQKALRWAAALLFVTGFVSLGVCGVWYLEARLYQHSEISKFRRPLRPRAAEPQTEARTEVERAEPERRRVGDSLSMIEIPRIGVSAVVVEGVTPHELRIAAGHVPGTALPGEIGNVGIAAHRDTFFRKLSDIRQGDAIMLTTAFGSYQYTVESTAIVDPSDVEELRDAAQPTLTLITCYPFYFVGAAPQRFIVRARQIAAFATN